MADNFGIHIISSTTVRAYKNGTDAGYFTHPVRSGGFTSIVALDTDGFHVDRIEWRSGGPTGTLLDSDDFTSLAAWTVAKGTAAIDPAGYLRLYGGGTSEFIRRSTPSGADYVEMFGCYFPSPSGANHWGMVSIGHDGTSWYGENGYRVLLREYAPNEVQVPDGAAATPISPTVGSIGFGAF